jgi:ribosomal-protein-alanine N-acetyltransferase
LSLLKALSGIEEGPVLHGRDIYLRTPSQFDYDAWSDLRSKSRDFLQPWEPLWPRDDLTRAAYRRRLRRYNKDIKLDSGYAFFIFNRNNENLLGGLNISNIRRGVTQSCTLGYWIGEPFHNQGIMKSALKLVIPFIFKTLRLHRIEAACMPSNKASISLLTSCGFEKEGFARSYLKIAGKWEDHLLFGCINDQDDKS